MSTTAEPIVPTSLSSGQRSLAPDLARGVMLLLIVLANTPYYLYGSPSVESGAHPADGSVIDRVVQFMIITVVDARVYPMFAFLFGYGIVQLYRSRLERGAEVAQVRGILRRRHLWMIAIGAVHAALLWFGDIIGTYGVIGLIMVAAFLTRRDTTLKAWAIVMGVLLASTAVFTVVGGIVMAVMQASLAGSGFDMGGFDLYALLKSVNGQQSWVAAIPWRLGVWLVFIAQGLIALTIPTAMLLAFWAARHRILEEPEAHLPLLKRVAVVGLSVAWLFGGLHGLAHIGVLPVPDGAQVAFTGTQSLSGLFGGVGYVALFGLLAARLRGATGPVITSLTAVGKRSMSSYLLQSVLAAPLLAAWGLGLGGWFGSAQTAALAVGIWLVSVVLAVLLERAGRRGPAETLLRRLSYPRR